MRRLWYSFRRATLRASDSSLRFWRRWSTEMPMVRAYSLGIPAAWKTGSVSPYFLPRAVFCVAAGSWKFCWLPYLQLIESEATALPDAAVVLDGRASHDGAELVDGTGGDGGGLGPARFPATGLRAGLDTRVRSQQVPKQKFRPNDLGGKMLSSRIWGFSYLVEVGADPTLPVLAEIYPPESVIAKPQKKTRPRWRRGENIRLLMSFWLCLIVCTSRRNQWSVAMSNSEGEIHSVPYHFGGSRSITRKGAG